MVEYINYSLFILALLASILILVRMPDRAAKALSIDQRKAELNRELAKIPIPWGWPNYVKVTDGGEYPEAANGHAPSFTESLHHWTNRLVQEKPTVDDAEYQRKKEGCMRTMLEDRYGRSVRLVPVPNTRVTTDPLSAVPATAREQSEIFHHGRVDKIEAKLLRKGQMGEIFHHVRQLKLEQQTGLEHLKMPWGW